MGRYSHVASKRSREPGTVQSNVARAIGDAAARCRVRLDRAACSDHGVERRASRRIASSRPPCVRVGLESGQCRQRPSLQLERITTGYGVTDSSIDVRQARRRRPAHGPSGPRPRVLGTHHIAWLEGDRKTYIARKHFVVTAAEPEPRSRQEHAAALESYTSSALHHIEGAGLDECDSPASRDFLLRVVMRLVGRMVEAADRDVRRREQGLVAVHSSRVIKPGRECHPCPATSVPMCLDRTRVANRSGGYSPARRLTERRIPSIPAVATRSPPMAHVEEGP